MNIDHRNPAVEQAINKLQQAELKAGDITQVLLGLSQMSINFEISDDLQQTFDKLARLMKSHGNDKELKNTYNKLAQRVNQASWKDNYKNEWKYLNNYLSQLENYLLQKYPLEDEFQGNFDSVVKITQSSIACLKEEINTSCIDLDTIAKEIEAETNHSYREISLLLSTSNSTEIIAVALNMSIDGAQEYLNAGKKVEIMAELLKAKKLGFVVSQLIDNMGNTSKT